MAYIIPISVGTGSNQVPTLTVEKNLVLVGANGAGKTRLGVWIEQTSSTSVYRISAQKALTLPDSAVLLSLEQAQTQILQASGTSFNQQLMSSGKSYRLERTPVTGMLDDYGKLLSLLFARKAARDSAYVQQAIINKSHVPVDESPIEIIVKVWSELMPHRSIVFSDGKVMVSKPGIANYHGREMSDGERVVLYLIGQCLCASSGSIIIIDEPEIHIHRSIVTKLWNTIEEYCPDKSFVYITHDLEFAASRVDAAKVWVKSYNGNYSWELDFVPDDDELPESLMLEIIGNRKNIIFCEGDKGSFDSMVYQLVYPDFHVLQRGGCEKVIEATKALRNNTALHHLRAFGIIDSDYREDEEKAALLRSDVYTLPVAEIDNMFCIEPILRIIAEHLELPPDIIVSQVVDLLVKSLISELDVQVSSRAEKKIGYMLGAFSKKGHSHSEQGLTDALAETNNRINVAAIYKESQALFRGAVNSKDLAQLLLLYNRKSLLDRISLPFGLANGEYAKLLIRLLKGPKKQVIIDALKIYLPNLS